MDRHSLRVTLSLALYRKLIILVRYFLRFLSDKDMVWVSKSWTKPTYATEDLKSWPFVSTGCQGTPSGAVIDRIVGIP